MSRTISTVLSLSLVICFLFFATISHAQYRASIQGVVTDQQGAIVPGARVTLTDLETSRVLEATSNDEGVYSFSTLPPNRFRLEVEKAGFKKKVLDNVQIIAEQSNALNVQLEVGATGESVTVNAAEAPLIDTQTA